jgi:hypothetical protein
MHTSELIRWDLYEIRSDATPIHGVKLRGRIRKLGIDGNFNVLCENASDTENCVRFALPSGESPGRIIEYLQVVAADLTVSLVEVGVANPVLSKRIVNQDGRYVL